MSVQRVKKIRRIYLAFSLFLGIASPLLCWYLIPDFNPITKPLSYFGVVEPTDWFWNGSLLIIAIALYINANKSLCNCIKKETYVKILRSVLLIGSVSLCLTALVSMNYLVLHRLSAVSFFLSYNLFVFLFGLFRSLKYVRKGLFSIIIGSSMLLSSLLIIPFPSYGVFELVYIVLVLFWNIGLFSNRIKKEDIELEGELIKAK